MLLVGARRCAVALATTHLPLRGRAGARSRAARSSATLAHRLHARPARALRHRRGRASRVCGLNPHAGEGGHLGREEIDVIAPALAAARGARHRRARARCPPTRCSCRTTLARFDAVLAMYHDQGLPVLKHAELRPRRQRHARPALRAHLGRPRHGARPRARPAKSGGADAGSLVAALELRCC
ncbi:MAG: 4-hydroxythreonine-4-phosphate dehydrogenase PdxA [Rhodopseudomonas palustris]|nr:4-hydroxythreonine-4-phosphate dehydrogenase PdxA [Rhodopseudomonas palustris]